MKKREGEKGIFLSTGSLLKCLHSGVEPSQSSFQISQVEYLGYKYLDISTFQGAINRTLESETELTTKAQAIP